MLVPVNARHTVLHNMKKGGKGAEIGVHLGNFSANILQMVRPKRLYLIDPWSYSEEDRHKYALYGGANTTQDKLDERYQNVKERFAKHIKGGQVTLLRELSEKAAGQIPDRSLDFVYIDGDHSRQGVTADMENYWPKLTRGSLMICDDYSLTGWWGDGVVASVHDFLAKNQCQVLFSMDNQIGIKKI